MFAMKWMAAAVVMLGLSACGNGEPVTRNLTMNGNTLSVAAQNATTVQTPRYNVVDIRVAVPQHLRVSEANVFYPLADIVWRGDPLRGASFAGRPNPERRYCRRNQSDDGRPSGDP